MSHKCIICGKKDMTGNNVSHSHRKTKRKFRANLQNVRIILDGARHKELVCTSCIKAGKIQKA